MIPCWLFWHLFYAPPGVDLVYSFSCLDFPALVGSFVSTTNHAGPINQSVTPLLVFSSCLPMVTPLTTRISGSQVFRCVYNVVTVRTSSCVVCAIMPRLPSRTLHWTGPTKKTRSAFEHFESVVCADEPSLHTEACDWLDPFDMTHVP